MTSSGNSVININFLLLRLIKLETLITFLINVSDQKVKYVNRIRHYWSLLQEG